MINPATPRPSSCHPYRTYREAPNPQRTLKRPASWHPTCSEEKVFYFQVRPPTPFANRVTPSPPVQWCIHKSPVKQISRNSERYDRISRSINSHQFTPLPRHSKCSRGASISHFDFERELFSSPNLLSTRHYGICLISAEGARVSLRDRSPARPRTPRRAYRHHAFTQAGKTHPLIVRPTFVGSLLLPKVPLTTCSELPLASPVQRAVSMEGVVKIVLLSKYFPFDPASKKGSELRKGLHQLMFLYLVLDKSVRALIRRDFEAFDALVGENACQIRAVKIVLIAREAQAFPQQLTDLQRRVHDSYLQVEWLLKSIDQYMRKGVNLEELMRLHSLDISLSMNQNTIFSAYLLTIAKALKKSDPSVLRRVTVGDRRRLSEVVDVEGREAMSSKFTAGVVRTARGELSRVSVEFVQERAALSKDKSLQEMTGEKYQLKHNSWPVIPMYWTYSTLVETMRDERIPVLFRAIFMPSGQKEELFFAPKNGKREFEYMPLIDFRDLHRPAIIVEGIVNPILTKHGTREHLNFKDWKALMIARNLEVLLAGAADHRQYPNEEMDVVLRDVVDPNFENHKDMALREGFSHENSTGFFIQHVYTALPISLQPK